MEQLIQNDFRGGSVVSSKAQRRLVRSLPSSFFYSFRKSYNVSSRNYSKNLTRNQLRKNLQTLHCKNDQASLARANGAFFIPASFIPTSPIFSTPRELCASSTRGEAFGYHNAKKGGNMLWDTKSRGSGKTFTGIRRRVSWLFVTELSTRLRSMQISLIWSVCSETFQRLWQGWKISSRATLTSGAFLSITLILSAPCPDAFAEIPTETATKILIGEACNLGPVGMQAVAEVLRRRDPSAFSTLRRKDLDSFIAKQVAWYKSVKKQDLREVARTAWTKSKHSNITKGATLYENLQDFGFPKSWDRRKVEQVAVIGPHTFFKEKKG